MCAANRAKYGHSADGDENTEERGLSGSRTMHREGAANWRVEACRQHSDMTDQGENPKLDV